MMISGKVKDHVNSVLQNNKAGPVTKWNMCINKLIDANIVYLILFKPGEFGVHPSNKGGLGLNHHNCHHGGGGLWGGRLRRARSAYPFVFEKHLSLNGWLLSHHKLSNVFDNWPHHKAPMQGHVNTTPGLTRNADCNAALNQSKHTQS